MKTTSQHNTSPFLQGGGEMGDIIRRHDWASSPLGSIDTWPVSLLATVGNILHSAFPMFLFWGEDLICFYNDAYRPSLGSEGKHPAIGKKGVDVWPEIWDFIGPLIEKVMTTGEPSWFQDQLIPIYREGGLQDVYWTFSYSPAYDDAGAISGVLVTCIETTTAVLDRKRIEAADVIKTEELRKAHSELIEANQYLQKIINLFKEPLQVLEPVIENDTVVDFRYKLTNASYSAYANVSPEELYDKKVSDVFPGYVETTSFSKNVETYITGIPDTWEIHYDKDGLDLYNQMSSTKMDNAVVVHFTDFSKLKHLQLELERKIEELEGSNQRLEEFTHAASHDLKEPIRKINVFTAMLKGQLRDQLKTRELQTLERIESAAFRMELLVDDLLLYSHISQQAHEKEQVDLNDIVQQVLDVLDLEIEQRAATIRVAPLPVVNGYNRQLQQLFQNLVSNALKYSKPDVPPVINISIRSANEEGRKYHAIEVADNGIGFEQQYADKIFQMFTRLHGKGDYSGTGVGLSIVKKVISDHQGMIRVESTPGVGTKFLVYLPA